MMKTSITNRIALFAIVAMSFVSCKSKLDKIGPEICPTKDFVFSVDDLEIEGLNGQDEIDFSTGGLKISMNFGEKLPWTLKIYSDDAQKDYSGTGDSLSLYWYGNANTLPMFKAGKVKIEVEVPCRAVIVKEITLTGDPTFKGLNGSYGTLLRDWDKNGTKDVADTLKYTAGTDGYFYGDWINNDPITGGFIYTDSSGSPMGGRYLKLVGKTTIPEGTWYFGANEMSGLSGKFNVLSTLNPDSLYLNIFVRKGENDQNTGLQLNLLRSGQNYKYSQDIAWTGWKCVSIKLSNFKLGSGESLPSMTNVTSLGLNLGAQPLKAVTAELNLDFIIITVGEPFIN